MKKKELNYDMARCNPSATPCPSKMECARFTSLWNPNGMQTCMDGSIGIGSAKQCDMFITNQTESTDG